MKIVFYGGRQAQILCDHFRRVVSGEFPQWVDADVKVGPPQEAWLAAADVVAVEARGATDPAPPECRAEIVLFPELALDALWPFGGQPHRVNTGDNLFPSGPFPVELGDAWLNRRLEQGGPLEAIEAEYLALDIAAMLDLDGYLQFSLERQAEIDRLCGTDFAARFAAEFRERPLFLNPLRPAPDLLRDVARPLFAKLGAPEAELSPRGEAEAPIHPSVAAHFGLRWTQGRDYRDMNGGRVGFPEFLRRYLAYAEGPDLEAGLRLAAQGRSEESGRRLAVAAARPMGARALAAQAQRPSPESSVELSDSAALRVALAQRPGDFELQCRLTVALSSEGDLAGALQSAQAQVALRPDSPHARAALAHLWQRSGDDERAQAELAQVMAIVAVGEEYAALRAALNARRLDPP